MGALGFAQSPSLKNSVASSQPAAQIGAPGFTQCPPVKNPVASSYPGAQIGASGFPKCSSVKNSVGSRPALHPAAQIGALGFAQCSSLTNSVGSGHSLHPAAQIGAIGFSQCSSVKNSVASSLPAAQIGALGFAQCPSLKNSVASSHPPAQIGASGLSKCSSVKNSVGSRASSHPAAQIAALGLSQCPCFCGKSVGPIRAAHRPFRRRFRSLRNLQLRSQLPGCDDGEERSRQGLDSSFGDGIPASPSPEGSDSLFGDRIPTSPSAEVSVGEGGDGGNRKQPQPQSQATIPYKLVTALGSVGLVETAYLTWSKISGASVACSVDGAGSCSDVLDSSYATVFGIPLPLVGMTAYGALAVLGGTRLLSRSSNANWAEEEKWARWLSLGITAAMGTASIYFMYILVVKLEGASCAYCVSSAVLSLSLLLCSLQGFTGKDITKMAGVQVAAGALVVLALSVAYDGYDADLVKAQDLDLPFAEPEVVTSSSPRMISLAKHLQSVGARMYGAFWCSHCYEQKQMLGREAMKYVDYVECYPEGYRKGVSIARACDEANIQGFPTWIIKGQILSGEQELDDLAKVSGFDRALFE